MPLAAYSTSLIGGDPLYAVPSLPLPMVMSVGVELIADETFGAASITAVPEVQSLLLQTTSGANLSIDDLILNISLYDDDSDPVFPITDFRVDNESLFILQYHFDENISTNATGAVREYSARSMNATLGSGTASTQPTWRDTGKFGGAYYFDGGDYIIVEGSELLNVSGVISYFAWINVTTYTPWQRIIGKYYYPDWDVNSTFYIILGDKNMTGCYINYEGTGYKELYARPNSVSEGVWHHVGCVYDGKSLKNYIDGEVNSEANVIGSVIENYNYPITIGTTSNGVGYQSRFIGLIDNVFVSNQVLSENEVRQLYSQGFIDSIPSSMTSPGEVWTVAVTPSANGDIGNTTISNNVTIASIVNLTSCGQILSDDTMYSLSSDITSAGSNCLDLTGLSNVHIDCSGYSINGTDTADTYGILADGASNITISGCIIRDYDRAIWINNVTDITITTTTLRRSTIGLLLNSTADGSYRDVIADNNGEGIVILNSQGNLFTFVNVSASTTYGIRHQSSTDTIFNMSANELGYSGAALKLYSTSALTPLSMYNRGYWPIYDENGASVMTVDDTAWYSGTYGGRNPDGSTNLSLRFYRSKLNISTDPNPGYSDVLLITIHNSDDSVNISQYFIDQRGIQHVIEVFLPEPVVDIPYVTLEQYVINPIRGYLADFNGTINYFVLTKGMPTATSEPGYPDVGSNYNQSSLDSEIALINSDWESSMGGKGKVTNPYYNWSSYFTSKFSGSTYSGRASFSSEGYGGIRLVTRLDGFNAAEAKALLDRASNIRRNEIFNSTAILLNVIGAFTQDITLANATLTSKGMTVIINTSTSSSPTARIPNIHYDTISYIEFYQHTSFSPDGLPNITFINGSLALPRYSWAGKYVSPLWSGQVDALGADMLSMGATFAYASSTEPFTSGSYESSILARNFVDGYPFADMVWNAIPHLSWSTTLFGDPKGTFPMAFPSVIPSTPSNFSDIACSVNLVHPPGRWMNITAVWYKNGVLQENLTANLTGIETGSTVVFANVTSGNLSVGENWTCGVSTYVKGTFSSEFLASNVTIIYNNSMPVVIDVGITPSLPTSDDPLEGTCTSSDTDVQNHTYYYKWYKNDVIAKTVSNPGSPVLSWGIEIGNATGNDLLEFVINTSDGGMIAAGFSVMLSAGSNSVAYVMKVDSDGNQLWNYSQDNMLWESLYSGVLTDDGSIVLVGYSGNNSVFNYDMLVLKINSSGSLLWRATFDQNEIDIAYDLVETPDGGFLLAGYTHPVFVGTMEGWIVRINATGGHLWNVTLDGDSSEILYSALLTDQQDYLLFGYTSSWQAQGTDAWLVRINDSGDLLLNTTIGGAGTDYIYEASETNDGGYLMVGLTSSWDADNQDVWIMKLNSSLSVEWNRTYGGSSTDAGRGSTETDDGHFIVTGNTYSFSSSSNDLWVLKVNASGGLVWNFTQETPVDETGNAITGSQDSYVTVGFKDEPSGSPYNMWMVRIEEEGAVQRTSLSYSPGTPHSLATVLASETTLGDSWLFSCMAHDSMNSSAWVNSSWVYIADDTEEVSSTTTTRRRSGWRRRSNRTFVEHSWGRLPTGYNLSWELGHPDIGITWIKHGVRKRIDQAYLSVERHSLWPAGVKVPYGAFYQFLEIERALYTTDQVGPPIIIEFEVSVDWLMSNKLSPQDVVMKRLSDRWTYLPTRLIGRTSDVLTYEAKTPDFSLFVIGERNLAGEEVGSVILPEKEIMQEVQVQLPPEHKEPSASKAHVSVNIDIPGWIVIAIIMIMLIGGVVFGILYLVHQRHKSYLRPPLPPSQFSEEQPRNPSVQESEEAIMETHQSLPPMIEPLPAPFVDVAPSSSEDEQPVSPPVKAPEPASFIVPEPVSMTPSEPETYHLEEQQTEPDQPVKSWIPTAEHEEPVVTHSQLDYQEHFQEVIHRADEAIASVRQFEEKIKNAGSFSK